MCSFILKFIRSLCRSTHSVKHFKLSVHKGNLTFGQETFADIDSFLQHFKNCPLIGDDTGINQSTLTCDYHYLKGTGGVGYYRVS